MNLTRFETQDVGAGRRSRTRVALLALFYVLLGLAGYAVYQRFDSDDDVTPEDPQLETIQWNQG